MTLNKNEAKYGKFSRETLFIIQNTNFMTGATFCGYFFTFDIQ